MSNASSTKYDVYLVRKHSYVFRKQCFVVDWREGLVLSMWTEMHTLSPTFYVRELRQTMTATATGTPASKKV